MSTMEDLQNKRMGLYQYDMSKEKHFDKMMNYSEKLRKNKKSELLNRRRGLFKDNFSEK